MTTPPFLTADEVKQLCCGLTRPNAIYRHCVDKLKLQPVGRMPNGLPIILRETFGQRNKSHSSEANKTSGNAQNFLTVVNNRKVANV